jgi:hypothetical protein
MCIYVGINNGTYSSGPVLHCANNRQVYETQKSTAEVQRHERNLGDGKRAVICYRSERQTRVC